MLLTNTLALANISDMNKYSEMIDFLGGNERVAKICEPTLPAVVSGWRKRGIPRGWLSLILKMHPEAKAILLPK